MDLLNFIFRLGVVFAIYGFIWGLIEFGFILLSAGRKRSLVEVYSIKAVKYFFLTDVTFLICFSGEINIMQPQNQIILGAIILLTYFIGKFQQKQNQQALFQMTAMMGNNMFTRATSFNAKAESFIIAIMMLFFALFWAFPDLAMNPLSNWFKESIVNIEDTPIFGFIFKVIGFFFLLNMLFKMVNGFNYLLSGKAFQRTKSSFGNKNKDDFDSYEEID